MTEPGQRNHIDESGGALSLKILRMFAGYTIAISILRIAGWGRLVYGIIEGPAFARNLPFLGRGMPTGGWLFTALPIVIAIYAYATRLNERSRLSVMVFSLFALLNHALALLLVMMSFAWSFMMAPAFFRIGGPFIVGGAAIFMGALFKSCRDLGKLRQGDPSKALGDWDALVISILIGGVFLLSYSLKEPPIQVSEQFTRSRSEKAMELIELEDCTEVEGQIRNMRLSPDGRLLALSSNKGVILLDAQSLEQLFRDDTINPWSVRFSASGKYFAAAGTGISGDKSCIAVYEVDGFRRLEQVSLPPSEDPLYIRDAVDVAFRHDEKSVLSIYYDYIDDMLFQRSAASRDEWSAIKERDGISYPLEWTQTCDEIELSTDRTISSKEFDAKNKQSINSFQFSPDAETLLCIHEFRDQVGYDLKRLCFIDTKTWQETESYLEASKFNVNGLFTGLLDSGKLFFFYQRIDSMLPTDEIFAEFDVKTEDMRDIAHSKMAKLEGYPYDSFTSSAKLSPDGATFVFLGTNRTKIDKIEEGNFIFFILEIDTEGVGPPKVRHFRLNFEEYRVNTMIWIDNETLLLAASRSSSSKSKIFYIKI